jgi:SAM-dependent methyltransferase
VAKKEQISISKMSDEEHKDVSLNQTNLPLAKDETKFELCIDDMGHRLGNFHNYYKFHPPSDRMSCMTLILDHIRDTCSRKLLCMDAKSRGLKSSVFHYCDLGCNEGDLTIQLAETLQENLQQRIEFLGLDIDKTLIDRAEEKWKNLAEISGQFKTANLCTDLDDMLEDQSTDLISLLSTTMWIHIQAGDDGLENLLKLLCKKSRRFLIIEPQPSKCYRNAMIRLRRLGRPELDVSSSRLSWRLDLEQQIEKTLESCSFYRVLGRERRTSWKRSIQLYELRV